MGLNIGFRVSLGRKPRITKSLSIGRGLLWLRKGKVSGSVRTK
jgi:hypothetical protein